MESIPDKAYFRSAEVCQVTDTQPYVLRFWESEFPQLRPRKNRSGQKVYSRDAVELILHIKKLLHEDEMTLADAREHLDRAADGRTGGKRARKPAAANSREAPGPTPPAKKRGKAASAKPAGAEGTESLRAKVAELRERYDAACEEIERLKADAAEARKTERELEAARHEAEALRERALGQEKKDDERVVSLQAEVAKLRKSLRRAEASRKRSRQRSRAVAKRLEGLIDSLARPRRSSS